MSIDKNDAEIALDMLNRDYLRQLVKEKGLSRKVDDSRSKDELKEALIAEDLDEDRLLDAVEEYKKESDPLGYYVGVVEDTTDIDKVEQEVAACLSETKAQFDADKNLEQEGFELSTDGDGSLSGIYWTKTVSYNLNPQREIYTRETLYDTNFRFDFKNDVIYIGASLPTKAEQLVNVLDDHGISIREVGQHSLFIHPDSANMIFENFVENLKSVTRETSSQAGLNEFKSGSTATGKPDPTLKIYSVELLAEDESLEEVGLGGKSDIFTDEGVEYFIEQRGGKITRISGKFNYKGQAFTFKAGYGSEDSLGRISVEKRGSSSIDPKLVDECFDFLSTLYIKHFVNFESYEP